MGRTESEAPVPAKPRRRQGFQNSAPRAARRLRGAPANKADDSRRRAGARAAAAQLRKEVKAAEAAWLAAQEALDEAADLGA